MWMIRELGQRMSASDLLQSSLYVVNSEGNDVKVTDIEPISLHTRNEIAGSEYNNLLTLLGSQ